MKIECYTCKREFDMDSSDIIYRVIGQSFANICYGFECRTCKEIEQMEIREREMLKKEKEKKAEYERNNKKGWF